MNGERLLTMADRILENYPNTLQAYDYDCGVTALQTVFSYFDVEVLEGELIKELKPDKESGTSELNMIATAKKYGFKVKHGKMTYDELKKYVDAGYPIIVLVQAWADRHVKLEEWESEWDAGHYVVVIGFENNILIFEDPFSLRRTWMEKEEFMTRWHSYNEYDEKVYNFGMVLYGKKKRKTFMEHME